MEDTPLFTVAVFLALVTFAIIAVDHSQNGKIHFSPTPAWIGIQVLEIDKTVVKKYNLDYKHGVLVRNVITGSPADEAGITEGDIIRKLAGNELLTVDQLRTYLRKKLPGQKIRMVYIRDGITITANVTLEYLQINDPNLRLVYGAYPVAAPPTNKPYPHFYFGEKDEPPERE